MKTREENLVMTFGELLQLPIYSLEELLVMCAISGMFGALIVTKIYFNKELKLAKHAKR